MSCNKSLKKVYTCNCAMRLQEIRYLVLQLFVILKVSLAIINSESFQLNAVVSNVVAIYCSNPPTTLPGNATFGPVMVMSPN